MQIRGHDSLPHGQKPLWSLFLANVTWRIPRTYPLWHACSFQWYGWTSNAQLISVPCHPARKRFVNLLIKYHSTNLLANRPRNWGWRIWRTDCTVQLRLDKSVLNLHHAADSPSSVQRRWLNHRTRTASHIVTLYPVNSNCTAQPPIPNPVTGKICCTTSPKVNRTLQRYDFSEHFLIQGTHQP